MDIRLDNATCLVEAQKTYERIRLIADDWYRKQLIMFGGGPNKTQNEITRMLNDTIDLMALTLAVDVKIVKGKTRKSEYVILRHIMMYTLVKKYRYSLKAVGRAFGGRDHSTVISACKNVTNWIARDFYYTTEMALLDKIYVDRPQKNKQ